VLALLSVTFSKKFLLKILRLVHYRLLDMVAGPGGRRLRGRLPHGKSPSFEAAGFHQQDTEMDSLPFSICLRSFIPD